MKKFKFEDLQPHVDMLCDALENRGASASGLPYNTAVYECAARYRQILQQVRNSEAAFESLIHNLNLTHQHTVLAAGTNQTDRIKKIATALDSFIIKEFDKINNEKN